MDAKNNVRPSKSKLSRARPVVLRILRIAVAVYIGFSLLAWWKCDGILFPVPAAKYTLEEENIVIIDTPEGRKVPARWMERPGAHWTVLYFHGNADDLGSSIPSLDMWQLRGFSVLAVEYPGYGRADGTPSEEGCYDAAFAGYSYLRNVKNINPEQIIAFGFSLGGGVAIDLASMVPLGAVIVESTFLSALRVSTGIRVLPFDRFNNLGKIKDIQAPLMVIHGDADPMVPIRHGQALYRAADNTPNRWFLSIAGARHGNASIVGGERYWQEIFAFCGANHDRPPAVMPKINRVTFYNTRRNLR